MSEYAKALPSGRGVVIGPPGTGKTTLMTYMLMPVFRHKIMVITPKNKQVDSVIKKIAEIVKRDVRLNKATIARQTAISKQSCSYQP